jgi:colanic acid/amylovoran biosynthesis protein
MKVYLDCLAQNPTVSIGTQAFILANMEIIQRALGRVTFIMLSGYPEIGYHFCAGENYDVTILKRSSSRRDVIHDVLSIKRDVDAIVSAWGDGYVSSPPHTLFNKATFLRCRNKPVVLFPSSIGPFSGGIRNVLVKNGLRAFDEIMARDTITYEWLRQMGLAKVGLIHDTAYALDPAQEDRVESILRQEGVPPRQEYLGLNISQHLNCLYRQDFGLDYPGLMAKLATVLHQWFGLHVLLVPHQIYPHWFEHENKNRPDYPGSDDRLPIQEVMKLLAGRDFVTPILGEYSANEYKGVIGRCEIFIGGRMHSVIAAMSSEVPSVLIQYSHKAGGVMDLMGLSNLVWDYRSSQGQLLELIQHVWDQRPTIRTFLANKMVTVRRDVFRAGDILRETFGNYGLL